MKPAPQRLTACCLAWILVLLLAACGSQPKVSTPGARPADTDGPSTAGLTAADIKDAVPKNEPRARYGNHSPYEVFGKKYYVLPTAEGYRQRGTASWYGAKFHGRRTSSGEPYDMHLATAAHKTLPLPCYAEVTNLSNGKKVIVKVNDRGPFKHDRLIDLSYGAALRLDMIGTGTAPVDVRVLDVSAAPKAAAFDDGSEWSAPASGNTWLQAGAFSKRQGAENLARKMDQQGLKPVSIMNADKLYRVWLGPFDNVIEADAMIKRAIELGFERPHKVER